MKLVFVYNANSGPINSILDSARKIWSPSTYPCNLCSITYGYFKEDKMWRNFREQSEIAMVFWHKDDFLKQYSINQVLKYSLPIVLLEHKSQLEPFIPSDLLNKIRSSEQLINEITLRLKTM